MNGKGDVGIKPFGLSEDGLDRGSGGLEVVRCDVVDELEHLDDVELL